MVEECTSCSCTPYEDLCCCPPEAGITITQPSCQTLPDGSIVGNPCLQDDFSYWTYKLQVNCAQGTRGVSSIGILICEDIHTDIITVEENIDGCGTFKQVEFERIKDDPNFGLAPEGFTWLKVTTNDRYDRGVCVLYRLSIKGDYPAAEQPIAIKAGPELFTFSCSDCYIVPGCPLEPKILVNKTCEEVIEDNMVTLNYAIDITNPGEINLPNVQFTDQITYDAANITVGNIETEPSLTVDTSTSGIINISGNLGNLDPGELTSVTIKVPINSIANPGKYNITETATAASMDVGVQATDECTLNVDAVRLRGDKCCSPGQQADSFNFRLQVSNVDNSPETNINVVDTIIIPPEVTIQFTSFDGCEAVFADNQQPVPLNTNIADRTVLISCDNLTISQSGSITKNIGFKVISTTAFNEPVTITNSLSRIEFLAEGEQILLGIDNVPVSAPIEVSGTLECQKPCQ